MVLPAIPFMMGALVNGFSNSVYYYVSEHVILPGLVRQLHRSAPCTIVSCFPSVLSLRVLVTKVVILVIDCRSSGAAA